MAKFTKVRDFTQEYDFAAFSVVRVNNSLVTELGGRNAWVRVSSPTTAPLFRRVRGAGSVQGLAKEAIELDYDSRKELLVDDKRDSEGFHPCDLEIQPASPYDKFRAHWSHPNVEYRVPFQIAIIGLLLGFIGLGLGTLSLVK